jgi:hypothetical protein
MVRFCTYVVFITLLLSACKENNNVNKIESLVKEWTGKTIKIPEIEPIVPYTRTGYSNNGNNSQYKILFYIDSAGCTKCKLQLHLWLSLIEKYKDKTVFLFFFHVKNIKKKEELLSFLKEERFNHKVYIDIDDELNKRNRFLSNPQFQCFLLDKDNKILAIGNPVNNTKVHELYRKIITGEKADKPSVTTIEVEQTEMELNDLQAGKTSETVFVLKNTGTNPLIIQRVESSCGCTVPEWEKQPVASGKSTEIKVKITPEKSEYFNKTVTVYCNSEKGRISFKVKGTVK